MFCGLAGGQVPDPNYHVSFSEIAGVSGAEVTVTCIFDDPNGGDVVGWSLAVCHDSALLTLMAAQNGATTQIVKNGGPPDIGFITLLPEGVTMAVIIGLGPTDFLPPGTDY